MATRLRPSIVFDGHARMDKKPQLCSHSINFLYATARHVMARSVDWICYVDLSIRIRKLNTDSEFVLALRTTLPHYEAGISF